MSGFDGLTLTLACPFPGAGLVERGVIPERSGKMEA